MKMQFELNLMSRHRPKARTTKFAMLALAFTLAAFTLPTTTWAGDNSSLKGPSAAAFFSAEDGCIITTVFVFVSDQVSHTPPGPPNPSSEASIQIEKFNTCAGMSLLFGFGSTTLSEDDFQVAVRLTSATLNTTISFFDDVSGTSFPVSVNLTWTGTGDLARQVSHFHLRFGSVIINSRFNGTGRNAEVAGSVSDGITNFTPNPGVVGVIQDVKSGEVFVNK